MRNGGRDGEKGELEPHLAARLAETRDMLSFSRPPAETEVVREIEIPGAEHLGGRKIQDSFKRTGRAPVAATPAAEAPGKKPKLEHHLAQRLKEVQDERVSGGAEAAAQAYRELRKKMGG